MPQLDRKTRQIAKTVRAALIILGGTTIIACLCYLKELIAAASFPLSGWYLVLNITQLFEATFTLATGLYLIWCLARWHKALVFVGCASFAAFLVHSLALIAMFLNGFPLANSISLCAVNFANSGVLLASAYILRTFRNPDPDEHHISCPTCDYPAKGLATIRCPECGEEYSPG